MAEATRLAPYVETLQAGLKVEPVKEVRLPIKETRLINITYSHRKPEMAARVVNAIADTFVRSNLERKTEANVSTGNILQQRVSELQAQIRDQERQLLDYSKGHQMLSLDAGQNTVVERLVTLNRQLLEAEDERKIAEAAYEAASAPGAADALAAGSARQTTDAEKKLSELRQRRAQLLVENTEEWPEVKEVDSQIAALEHQLEEGHDHATSVVLTNLSTRYRQAAAREEALRQSFNRQRGETLAQNEAAINYRIIQQEIATNKNLLDGLLQRSKENDAVLAGMRNNVHVNDYAVMPRVPVGPRRVLNTAVVLALSLGMSVGLAALLGRADSSVRSPADLERKLNLQALAAIPRVGGGIGRRLLAAPSALQKRIGGGQAGPELILDASASAPLTEAYRQLRTAMLLSPGRGALRSVLVTSGMPGEGKTTMAVNMAVSLSRTGARALIIDADLRRPRLHKIFGLENRGGLGSILAGGMSGVEAAGSRAWSGSRFLGARRASAW